MHDKDHEQWIGCEVVDTNGNTLGVVEDADETCNLLTIYYYNQLINQSSKVFFYTPLGIAITKTSGELRSFLYLYHIRRMKRNNEERENIR